MSLELISENNWFLALVGAGVFILFLTAALVLYIVLGTLEKRLRKRGLKAGTPQELALEMDRYLCTLSGYAAVERGEDLIAEMQFARDVHDEFEVGVELDQLPPVHDFDLEARGPGRRSGGEGERVAAIAVVDLVDEVRGRASLGEVGEGDGLSAFGDGVALDVSQADGHIGRRGAVGGEVGGGGSDLGEDVVRSTSLCDTPLHDHAAQGLDGVRVEGGA